MSVTSNTKRKNSQKDTQNKEMIYTNQNKEKEVDATNQGKSNEASTNTQKKDKETQVGGQIKEILVREQSEKKGMPSKEV